MHTLQRTKLIKTGLRLTKSRLLSVTRIMEQLCLQYGSESRVSDIWRDQIL